MVRYKKMSEFIRKLYIDSRYLTANSASSSDFEIELPLTVTVKKNALGWITDLHLPVTFYNVDEHSNRLYIASQANYPPNLSSPVVRYMTVELTAGNYSGATLAHELRRALNLSLIHI